MSDTTSWFDPSGLDPIVKPLVPLFTQLTGDRLDGLRAALANTDYEGMRRLAHTVKGSAASYGFAPIAAAAADLERALLAGERPESLRKHLDGLFSMHEALRVAVNSDPQAFETPH